MPPTPPPPSDRDPLRTLLDEAESELRQRLEDACEAEARGVSTESTEAVRRLEDNLLAAALAAKQTVALRGEMKRRSHAERERPIKLVGADRGRPAGAARTVSPEANAEKPVETTVMGVREFTDDEGRPWRAWSVVPGLSRASSHGGGKFLGDYQNGWICFESLGSTARRRLPFPQSKWAAISDEELKQLLQRAIDAPIREKKTAGR